MKTFEEQFTAWVDDRLPADEHAAFERALAARPDADALRAERRTTLRLRDLLRENLHAPALSNPDFFNHGIMERIAAEGRTVAVAPGRRRAAWWQWDWTPARLLAAGAACLLTALVGVRALIPTGEEKTSSPAPSAVAQNDPTPSLPSPAVGAVAPTPAPASVLPPGAGSRNDGQEAKLNVQPPPVPVLDPAPVPPPVTATPLHFDEGDADVIWLDGADYLPNLDGAAAASPSPAPAAAPR